MKNNFFKTKQLVKSIIVANLFNFWLNEIQLGFQICFCIQSVISHVMYLWKIALYTHESGSEKVKLPLIMKIVLTLKIC